MFNTLNDCEFLLLHALPAFSTINDLKFSHANSCLRVLPCRFGLQLIMTQTWSISISSFCQLRVIFNEVTPRFLEQEENDISHRPSGCCPSLYSLGYHPPPTSQMERMAERHRWAPIARNSNYAPIITLCSS